MNISPTKICDLCAHFRPNPIRGVGTCEFPLPYWVVQRIGIGYTHHEHGGDCNAFEKKSIGSGKRLKTIEETREQSLSVPVDMEPFNNGPDIDVPVKRRV